MCTPSEDASVPCGFANLPTKIIIPEEIEKLSVAEKPFTEINFSQLDEFLDYLKFPTLTLTEGTVLCHSTLIANVYDKRKGVNVENMYWWNKYFPGQSSYKGGWFTYETSYGGPNFGTNFYYRLQDDLTLLFIPNDFNKKYRESDPKYFRSFNTIRNKITLLEEILDTIKLYKRNEFTGVFYYGLSRLTESINNFIKTKDETEDDLEIKHMGRQIIEAREDITLNRFVKLIDNLIFKYQARIKPDYSVGGDVLNQYVQSYKGSHIIEGVEDWQVKGYLPLNHPINSYADDLALRVAELGFNGYISCDECEVYITHAAMARVLKQPFNFDSVGIRDPLVTKIIKKGLKFNSEPLNITQAKSRDDIIGNSFMSAEDFLAEVKAKQRNS